MSTDGDQAGLPAVVGADFRAHTEREGDAVRVVCEGNADLRVFEPLDQLLHAVDSLARQRSTPEVVVDFKALEFMNSSCFKGFVSWIGRIQDLEPGSRYRLRFVANPAIHWQQRSLHALRCFATELISVEF